MSERVSMINPPIEKLLDKVDSKFSLVTLAARRGRQINSYFSQLGEGLGAIVPPQVASLSRKPLSIALEEIAAEKIIFVRTPEIVPEGDGEAEGDAEASPAAGGTDVVDAGVSDAEVVDVGVAEAEGPEAVASAGDAPAAEGEAGDS